MVCISLASIMLSRRRFLTRAAGLSVAALALTLPETKNTGAQLYAAPHPLDGTARIPMSHKAREYLTGPNEWNIFQDRHWPRGREASIPEPTSYDLWSR